MFFNAYSLNKFKDFCRFIYIFSFSMAFIVSCFSLISISNAGSRFSNLPPFTYGIILFYTLFLVFSFLYLAPKFRYIKVDKEGLILNLGRDIFKFSKTNQTIYFSDHVSSINVPNYEFYYFIFPQKKSKQTTSIDLLSSTKKVFLEVQIPSVNYRKRFKFSGEKSILELKHILNNLNSLKEKK